MNSIKFSHNWNHKLDNDIFTTIRNWTPEKEGYYRSQLGKTMEVLLHGAKGGEARLLSVRVVLYTMIDSALLRLDTGMADLNEIKKLFINFGMEDIMSRMILLTFCKP